MDEDKPLLYHGTRVGFSRGGYLFPVDFHKSQPRPGGSDDGTAYVYMTTDLDLAWWYAEQHPGRGKPKVLVVEPLGPIEVDYSPYDNESDQYRCEAGAKVRKVLREVDRGQEASAGR